MPNVESAPIACALTPGDYKARLAWINELAADSLLSHERRDLELELVYATEAAQRVREMVRKEQDCCAFLSFELDEQPSQVRLTIKVPERARQAADTLLGQYLPAAEARAGCGCC
jgi:hypothetical protein